MNDHDHTDELPYLNDDDIKFCYAICEQANGSDGPPIRALFATFDAVLREHGLDPGSDPTYFPYILRVSNSVKKATEAAYPKRIQVDLVRHFKSVLEACGIIVQENSQYGDDDHLASSAVVSERSVQKPGRKANRRVSFDDARYEETWLSEHTENLHRSPALPGPRHLVAQMPRRGQAAIPGRRARSASLQRTSNRPPATQFRQQDPEPTETGCATDETEAIGPSETELDIKVDAFQSVTELRSARQTLVAWHFSAQHLKQIRDRDRAIANAYDHRTLLKQAFDGWRATLADILMVRRQSELEQKKFDRYDKKAVRVRDLMLVRKCFTHWAFQTEDEKLRTAVAHRHVLRFTYFNRWRAIAAENQAKVRSILTRKYLGIWRAKVTRSRVSEERAISYREDVLMRKCKNTWFWAFCSRRVEGWHELWIERHTLSQLTDSLEMQRVKNQQARDFYSSCLTRRVVKILTDRHRAMQVNALSAAQHFKRTTEMRSLDTLRTTTNLAPLARAVQQRTDRNTTNKALRVWQLHLSLSREAVMVDRRRLLQTAWTGWNDALRCRALAQKINERLVVENLYRWVLQERLRLFQRTIESKLLGRALAWWRNKAKDERDRLAEAEGVCAERQRRRRLASAMRELHGAVRHREDGERAAVEFSMSRALPRALDAWKTQAKHVRSLAKWAVDARFYCLCSVALKTWKDRTAENVANRRRNAYVQVRARIKIRLAKTCIDKLRAANAQVQSMNEEATKRTRTNTKAVTITAFQHWHERASRLVGLSNQATEHDRQKLIGSALAALTIKHADLERLDQQQDAFHHETNLALLAGALRRVQWATFTANRKVESADALWARNRDQHIKHMLRHWAAQTAARRVGTREEAPTPEREDEYPESPSLRPATRAASRSALLDSVLPSSPPTHGPLQSTPGYMRTPSRPRRGGRFRPLPTPAGFTPLAFDPGYLATTPSPLPVAGQSSSGEVHGRGAVDGLTPQITPFSRKLRAGGIGGGIAQSSALRRPDFARSIQGGTNKSVRFAGSSSRFKSIQRVKNS